MRLGLRAKLLLAASAMCLVPLAGYHYLQGMRQVVGASQESATRSVARAIARILAGNEVEPSPASRDTARAPFLYLLPVQEPLQVDGYTSDWSEFAPPEPLAGSGLLAASDSARVFLLASMAMQDLANDAVLMLRMQDSPSFARTWRVALDGHGRSSVDEIAPLAGARGPGYPDPRFSAAARRVAGGVVVEIAFPRAQLGARLALSVGAGATSPGRVASARLEAALALPPAGEYSVVEPRPALQARITGLAERGQRIWIVDRHGHVLARDGALGAAAPGGTVETVLNLLLPDVDDSRLTLVPSTGRIQAPELSRALTGVEAVRWRRATIGNERVVSAAVPVSAASGESSSEVDGAVIVEDAITSLQGLHTRGLVELGLTTLAAVVLSGLALLSVSARMVARLRELRDAAASAIDGEGRIRGEFDATPAADEIGDLSRSFGFAFQRIRAYNNYLEQLARRLSHELRTPVTIVRSSLENLAFTTDQRSSERVYLERAQDGVRRLDAMISRMTEATRLEQAVTRDERETVALSSLLQACVQASNQAYGDTQVRLRPSNAEAWVKVSAQLVVQALEKLLANARDFRAAGTAVEVRSDRAGSWVRVSVCNIGPLLDASVSEQMFDSMFSSRAGREDDGHAHLGLGLYLVRLIARGHGGDAFAHNLDDGSGVCIGFSLPLSEAPPG